MLQTYQFRNSKDEVLQEAYFHDDEAAEAYAEMLVRDSRDVVKFYKLCGTVEPKP